MRSLKITTLFAAAAGLLALAMPIAPASAQNTDNLTGVAKIVNTARVPGTTYAYAPRNGGGNGVQCTMYQASEVGSPSTVISVEVEDETSLTWQTLASAGAVSVASGTNTSVQVYPGAVATSVPTGLAVAGLKVGAIWRLKQVITGGTSTTGSASCDLLK